MDALFWRHFSANDLVHAGSTDAVGLHDLTEAVSLFVIIEDCFAIENERKAADGSGFQLGASHAGSYSFVDQATFKFGDCSDDDYEGTAQWAGGIDVFSEGDIAVVLPGDDYMTNFKVGDPCVRASYPMWRPTQGSTVRVLRPARCKHLRVCAGEGKLSPLPSRPRSRLCCALCLVPDERRIVP